VEDICANKTKPRKTNPLMANYQLTHLELSTRMNLALKMLDPEREWGEASALAKEYGVSRKFLYQLQDQVWSAVEQAILPKTAGRKSETATIQLDKLFIAKAIGVLGSLVPGSVRGIQSVLDLLFGAHRGVGTISETLKAWGSEALAYNQSIPLPIEVLGEADEIFQRRQPCLTLVDGRTFLVISLSAQEHRDATTWGCVFLDARNRGVKFTNLVSDEAKGILAGVKATELNIPVCPDLFHLMQDGKRISQRLEMRAYHAITQAERARRIEQEKQMEQRRKGRPMTPKMEFSQALAEEASAIALHDQWAWLLQQTRQALEPFSPENTLQSSENARANLVAAVELFKTLHNADVTAFAEHMLEKLDELVAPLAWLEATLTPLLSQMTAQQQTFLLWAWQNRQTQNFDIERHFPEYLHPLVSMCCTILGSFHRSSSLAESLHSWMRPHLQAHRGMPTWLLPMLQMVWNHHAFQRGKRKGKSPLGWANVPETLPLNQVFDLLATHISGHSQVA
jgi:hypothetical protein